LVGNVYSLVHLAMADHRLQRCHSVVTEKY